MARDTPPHPPTAGALLLGEYLRRHELTQDAAAKHLGVKDPAVCDWVNGWKRPESHLRAAIATWTGGDVPADAWLRDDEMASLAAVVPFVPRG